MRIPMAEIKKMARYIAVYENPKAIIMLIEKKWLAREAGPINDEVDRVCRVLHSEFGYSESYFF